MKQIITHLDPWPDIEREYESAVIIQKGSSMKYELPDGLKIRYLPSRDQAEANKKAFAFGVVKREAADWLEAHPGVEAGIQRRPIISANEKELHPAMFRNVFYADVKAAYWKTAKLNGIISEKTFQRIQGDKYIRNASIGALASKSNIYTWSRETGKKTFVETIEPPTAPAYWFISSFVAERMMWALPYCLFFWVDCAYCTDYAGISFLKFCFPPEFEFTEKNVSFVRWNGKEKVAFVKFQDKTEKPYHFQKFKFDFFDI